MSKISIKYHLIAVLMLLLSAGDGYGQIEKTLKFIPETLDFGTIRETGGKVTKTVKAVNISANPTFIISARTSCGCSEAEYDGRMLAPGDTAIVKITYDPTNRPGKFNKSAKIFTGRERISNLLRISGNVIPSAANLDKAYPERSGDLRLSTRIVSVGEIRRTESRPIFIGIYNDSDKPLPLRAESDSGALEATLQPDTIEPYGIATLSMMLKGRNIGNEVTDFKYTATVTDTSTNRVLVEIPIGGSIKENIQN